MDQNRIQFAIATSWSILKTDFLRSIPYDIEAIERLLHDLKPLLRREKVTGGLTSSLIGFAHISYHLRLIL